MSHFVLKWAKDIPKGKKGMLNKHTKKASPLVSNRKKEILKSYHSKFIRKIKSLTIPSVGMHWASHVYHNRNILKVI